MQTVFSASSDARTTYNSTLRPPDPASTPTAQVQYARIRETGSIIIQDSATTTYAVTHKRNSGRWEVRPSPEETPIITAHKTSWYKYAVDIQMADIDYRLIRLSFCNRHFALVRVDGEGPSVKLPETDADAKKKDSAKGSVPGVQVGDILRDKGIRRRYTLTFAPGIPLELQAFSYWLVNLFNRRNDGAAAGAAGVAAT